MKLLKFKLRNSAQFKKLIERRYKSNYEYKISGVDGNEVNVAIERHNMQPPIIHDREMTKDDNCNTPIV